MTLLKIVAVAEPRTGSSLNTDDNDAVDIFGFGNTDGFAQGLAEIIETFSNEDALTDSTLDALLVALYCAVAAAARTRDWIESFQSFSIFSRPC